MAIASLLLYALYTAVDIQLRHTQEARDVVEQSQLARALLRRITNDITPSLAPSLPQSATQSQGGGGAAGGGATAAATPTTGTTGATAGAAASAPMTTTAATGANVVTFNLGVQGTDTTLTLYVSRWPRELNFDPQFAGDQTSQPTLSDLRRVTYVFDNDNGLLRQEVKVATSDDALNQPAPVLDDGYTVQVADEVKSIQFRYWDGSNWQTSWDGTAAGSDGMTPQGPPMAIEITVGIALPNSGPEGGDPVVKTYRHVVALPTANGVTQTSTTTP